MAHPGTEIIFYGYEMAPNPQKLLQFLSLFGIPFRFVEVPVTMPRPMLAEIGITYRRTPLLSIESDMYIDNGLIVSKLADIAQHSDTGLDDNTNHLEYDSLGQMAFKLAVGLLPVDTPFLQDKAFLADRSELMGFPFNPESLAAARPETMSKMLCLLSLVERHFLCNGERKFFLGGKTPSTADMHLYWGLNWGLRYHQGARPEISETSHSITFGWLAAVEHFIRDRRHQTLMTIEEAYKVLRSPSSRDYAKLVPHAEGNPEKLSPGQNVKVTPTDAGRTGPQFGKLISLNYEQMCLRNEKGLVMHFPRMGYEIISVE